MLTKQELKESVLAIRLGAQKLAREGFCWSQEDEETIEDLFYEGVGLSQIAVELQRTETAVVQKCVTMGLFDQTPVRRRRRARPSANCCLCHSCAAADNLCPLGCTKGI